MTRETRCDPPRHDSDSDSVRVCHEYSGNRRDAPNTVKTGIDRGSSSDWESTGLSSAAVIDSGAEGRKAKAVHVSNRTPEASKYAETRGRPTARKG